MQSRNFYAILWIYMIEMTLVIVIIKIVIFDPEHFGIQTPGAQVYITRFAATLLMHMELIMDVKQGLNMI